MYDDQRLFKIISALVQKLGGEVTLTESEIDGAPPTTATTDNINQSVILKVDE